MRLFLVRHAQTQWNATNKAQGHVDVELDEAGHSQARLLARRLSGLPICRVLSSDLARCRQTLDPFVERTGLAVEERSDLRERTFGDMEGEDYSLLHAWMRDEARRLAIPDWEVRPPNGESMADVWARLELVEREIASESKPVLVVSHGGALAQLLGRLVRGTHETPRAFRFSNCGLTSLARRQDGSFVLESFNDCAHMEALVEAPAGS